MMITEGSEATATISLDEVLNMAAARPLYDALAAARGGDVDLNAAKVRHLGAQCGQIILAGLNSWRADGHTLRIVDAAPGFDEGVHLLGLAPLLADEEIES